MPFKKGETPKGAKPFKAGQSGNPTGKPAGTHNRSTSARRWLATEYTFQHPVTGATEKGTIEDAATIAQVRKALDGDSSAYAQLMDAAHGKVPTVIEGPEGGPVQVAHNLSGVSVEEKRMLLDIRRKLKAASEEASNG